MTSTMVRGPLGRALDHWSEVFGLALHLTGDRQRAEDVCQETFLRLARFPSRLDDTRSLRSAPQPAAVRGQPAGRYAAMPQHGRFA